MNIELTKNSEKRIVKQLYGQIIIVEMKSVIKKIIACLFCSCILNAALAQPLGKIIEEKIII